MLLRYSPKIDHLKMIAVTPMEGCTVEKSLIQLLPGVNEITDDEFKCIRANIADEIERGEITILAQKVSDGRGKPGGRKAKDLVQMPVNIAVTYVSECMNPETLVKWYKEETREEVRIHITKKLEKLGVEIPDVEIPEAPNASPMTLDEYDEEEDNSIDADANEEEDDINDELPEDAIDLNSLSKNELLAKAKELGIAGAEAMNKKQLVEAIASAN
jgi:hypothetical protein